MFSGLQLSANQDEVDVKETFQLEIEGDKVYLRNDQDKYWRVNGSSVQADANKEFVCYS